MQAIFPSYKHFYSVPLEIHTSTRILLELCTCTYIHAHSPHEGLEIEQGSLELPEANRSVQVLETNLWEGEDGMLVLF